MKGYSKPQAHKGKTAYRTPSRFIAHKTRVRGKTLNNRHSNSFKNPFA